MTNWLLMAVVALAAGGLAWAAIEAIFDRNATRRVADIIDGDASRKEKAGFLGRIMHNSKDERRRKLEESLEALGQKKKRVTLRLRLQRAGLRVSTTQFLFFAAILGVVMGLLGVLIGSLVYGLKAGLITGLAFLGIGSIGMPLWLLRFLAHRRQEKFLHYLPDAIELMVRGLRSGLPISDAMKIIAQEVPDPVAPEFLEVVEGQKLGIPIDKGLERMYERVPLPEVNFLQIVIAIQRETGGNLSEALANLAEVLRARKAMKLKVKAITQEAKVSALIVGGVPFVLVGGVLALNPEHLVPLYTTDTGKMLIVISVAMMTFGVVVMYKMINFKF